ncbi:hypothetical protein CTAYLR_007956 [Chrysophaeum taylorii]|uniref:FH2 domain-containing protein n=1 Tax=Chrysophaeum taylorii TaxID=2483200 RepID=A0AAD7UAT4_9STRA|nr:hypothetical protein CTAYLR_007956 [Chrysophaeum taylorii]
MGHEKSGKPRRDENRKMKKRGFVRRSITALKESVFARKPGSQAKKKKKKWEDTEQRPAESAGDGVEQETTHHQVVVSDARQALQIELHRSMTARTLDEQVSAKRALRLALNDVIENAAEQRRRTRGYTVFELAALHSHLLDLDATSKRTLRRKIQRILRVIAQDRVSTKSLVEKMGGVVSTYARQRGLTLEHHLRTQRKQPTEPRAEYEVLSEALAELLHSKRVLPNLITTLNYLGSKDKLRVSDAVTGLLVGTVIKTLLNMHSGLAILLSLPKERNAFRRLCVAALLCRVPLFTTRILEVLAALPVINRDFGYLLTVAVLREVDERAEWGSPCCSATPLTPTVEGRQKKKPPAFAALASLLEHELLELRLAVATLFTSLCNAVHLAKDRHGAMWLQAQIFHACRCVIAENPHREERRDTPKAAPVKRKSIVEKSESGDATVCAPLTDLLHDASKLESDDGKRFKISLERFLDSWDARELDDADQCDEEPRGSATRTAILGARLQRAALLLSHDDVDELVEVLSDELEMSCSKPRALITNASDPKLLDLDLTLTARLLTTRLAPEMAAAAAAATTVATTTGDPRVTETSSPPAPSSENHQASSVAVKDHPIYAKYFRMLRMHIPKTAVVLKMSSEGLDPSILDLNPQDPAPLPEGNGAAASWQQQQQQQQQEAPAPAPAVNPLAAMLKARAGGPSTTASSAGAEKPPPVAAAAASAEVPKQQPKKEAGESTSSGSGVALKDDPTYGKYFKQLKLHVPRMAIEAKMAGEGLDPGVLEFDPDKPMPAGKNTQSEGEAKTSKIDKGPPRGCVRPPTKEVRKVFLDLISDARGTWWAPEAPSHRSPEKVPQTHVVVLPHAALDELESVFLKKLEREKDDEAAAAAAAVADMEEYRIESTRRKKAEVRSFARDALGEKRAFALALLLSSLKMIPNVEIVATLEDLDATRLANLAQLGALYNILADADEVSQLTALAATVEEGTANLDELSTLVVDLRRVPRPSAKVRALWLGATLDERVAELHASIAAFAAATDKILESKHLKTILAVVFSVSNFLNHNTARADVGGVKVASLLKLKQTKTTTSHHHCKTLLQFVVKHSNVSASSLRADLPADALRAAYVTALPRYDVKKAIKDLQAERRGVEAEHRALEAEENAAAANAAEIVAAADEKLSRLQLAFDAMDDAVTRVLGHYGEAPTADAEAWIKSIDLFCDEFAHEHKELSDALNRRRKREALIKKQQQREADMKVLNIKRTTAAPEQPGTPRTSSWAGGSSRGRGKLDEAVNIVNDGSALETNPHLPSIDNVSHFQAKIRMRRSLLQQSTRDLAHDSDWNDDDDDDNNN